MKTSFSLDDGSTVGDNSDSSSSNVLFKNISFHFKRTQVKDIKHLSQADVIVELSLFHTSWLCIFTT